MHPSLFGSESARAVSAIVGHQESSQQQPGAHHHQQSQCPTNVEPEGLDLCGVVTPQVSSPVPTVSSSCPHSPFAAAVQHLCSSVRSLQALQQLNETSAIHVPSSKAGDVPPRNLVQPGMKGLEVLYLGHQSLDVMDVLLGAALVGQGGSVVGALISSRDDDAKWAEAQHSLQVGQQAAADWIQSQGIEKDNTDFLLADSMPDLCSKVLGHHHTAGAFNMVLTKGSTKHGSNTDVSAKLIGIYQLLAPGGELLYQGVFSDRRPSMVVDATALAAAGCLTTSTTATQQPTAAGDSGASVTHVSGYTYIEDFRRIARNAGFIEPRILHRQLHTVDDATARAALGDAKLFDVTLRLFKLPGLLETSCEDYGQVAVYKGAIPGCSHLYQLDVHHVFQAGKPTLVCGNTAAMVGEMGLSWLSPYFEVVGDRQVHYGLFCGDGLFKVLPRNKCCG